MTKFLLGAAVAAVTVAMAPAIAQTVQPAPVPPPAPLIERAPHVAKIHTRAEVGNHVRALFDRLDSNRDGYVTRTEVDARKGDRRERIAQRLERRGALGGRTADRGAMFDRMDANRDGYISRDEFARAPMREERRVVIRDGRGEDHHVRELGGRGARGMRGMHMGLGSLRGRMFEMADANRDGRVSLQEATAAAYRHFDTADVNRDGQITREERMQIRQRMRSERRPG